MNVKRKVSYGLSQALIDSSPAPVISKRTPSGTDRAEYGTLWVYKRPAANGGGTNTYIITGVASKVSSWVLLQSESVKLGDVASPTDDVAIEDTIVRGYATFTGFTTAAAATQEFSLVSDLIAEGYGILISAANSGANDAQMTVTRVEIADGIATVTLTNSGAAALNGDVIISFDFMF